MSFLPGLQKGCQLQAAVVVLIMTCMMHAEDGELADATVEPVEPVETVETVQGAEVDVVDGADRARGPLAHCPKRKAAMPERNTKAAAPISLTSHRPSRQPHACAPRRTSNRGLTSDTA